MVPRSPNSLMDSATTGTAFSLRLAFLSYGIMSDMSTSAASSRVDHGLVEKKFIAGGNRPWCVRGAFTTP